MSTLQRKTEAKYAVNTGSLETTLVRRNSFCPTWTGLISSGSEHGVNGSVQRHRVVYSFKKGSEVVRICKRFFLKTIDISHDPLITALKGRGEARPFMGADRRGRHTPANKTSDGAIQRVKTHIESFPQIESHK